MITLHLFLESLDWNRKVSFSTVWYLGFLWLECQSYSLHETIVLIRYKNQMTRFYLSARNRRVTLTMVNLATFDLIYHIVLS